eukprot:m.507144 g.507144  ORF g.507144 m.507144 type:complete len:58 (+) comp84923_c0_seq1:62-235(+)
MATLHLLTLQMSANGARNLASVSDAQQTHTVAKSEQRSALFPLFFSSSFVLTCACPA